MKGTELAALEQIIAIGKVDSTPKLLMNGPNLLVPPLGPNHHIIIHQDDDFTP